MKKVLIATTVLLLVVSCSTRRQMEKTISYGNYDKAILEAIEKLKVNKDRKGKNNIIILLQDAFQKAKERDVNQINLLKKDSNPESFIHIFDTYSNLNNRQERIKPILPLYVNNKKINFVFDNYSNELIQYKNSASLQLYNNATSLLNSNNKDDFRNAYGLLSNIEDINPNYKDVRNLLKLAHSKGIDYVLVDMINDSQKVIPTRLESDLLNFSSYGLDNFWVEYHSKAVENLAYDYNMRVNFRSINVSPEQIKERHVIKEKQITDGKKDLIKNGKVVKDSLGNVIKIDNLKTVRCEYYEFAQFKAAQVTGNIEYINLNTNQLVDVFPITSEFVFNHVYANATGDRRALDSNLLPFLDNRVIPFPSEEQMIYDTAEDLKMQLKNIINSYSLN